MGAMSTVGGVGSTVGQKIWGSMASRTSLDATPSSKETGSFSMTQPATSSVGVEKSSSASNLATTLDDGDSVGASGWGDEDEFWDDFNEKPKGGSAPAAPPRRRRR